MKIAFVLHRYFPHGGLQRDFYRIASLCIERGHAVSVYCQNWEGELLKGASITVLPPTAKSNHTKGKQFYEAVQAQLAKAPVDMVVGFNKMPGLDFYYAADVCYQEKTRKRRGILAKILPRDRHYVDFESAVFSKASETKLLLISEREKEIFQKHYETPESRFTVLPPGIAIDRFLVDEATQKDMRQSTRELLGLHKHEKMLLQVGSGFRTKGTDRAIKMVARLPESLHVKLFIVGDDHAAPYQRLAKRLKVDDRVMFTGPRDDVPQLMMAADVLIHLAYSENTGTVLVEAIAAGLPVIATDVCGYANHVTASQCGAILKTPLSLADAAVHVHYFLQQAHFQQAKKAGRAYVSLHDLSSMPEKVVNCLEGQDTSDA